MGMMPNLHRRPRFFPGAYGMSLAFLFPHRIFTLLSVSLIAKPSSLAISLSRFICPTLTRSMKIPHNTPALISRLRSSTGRSSQHTIEEHERKWHRVTNLSCSFVSILLSFQVYITRSFSISLPVNFRWLRTWLQYTGLIFFLIWIWSGYLPPSTTLLLFFLDMKK